ncbi:MAG: hypothetical protein ABIO02_01400, partial [Patescibacteria group bacterium]
MIKEFDFDTKNKNNERQKTAPKSSPKLLIILGLFFLIFILGSTGMKDVLSAKAQKPVASTKTTKVLTSRSVPSIDTQSILDQAKAKSADIGKELLKAGQQAGSAILGVSVKMMQKTASESAPFVASAAANLVIKSTVPALLDQIHKLPKDQQS